MSAHDGRALPRREWFLQDFALAEVGEHLLASADLRDVHAVESGVCELLDRGAMLI